jgi:hypothetical protein
VTGGRRVLVELFESERIASRGRRTVTHRIREHDAWVHAAEYPGARVEQLSPGPGTVWERRIEVELEPGTRVLRQESAPLPEPPRDALDYLVRERGRPRRARRERELVVGRRGELVDPPGPTSGPGSKRRPG